MPLDELHSVLNGMYHRVPWRHTQTHTVMGMLMDPIGPHPSDQSPTDPQGSRPEGRGFLGPLVILPVTGLGKGSTLGASAGGCGETLPHS